MRAGGEHQEAGQRRARDEARVGGEHHHDERDGDRRDHTRPLRRRAGLLVDGRARQRARARHALEEAAHRGSRRPSLRHCWLMSSFCPVTAAMALAIEMASSSPSSAIASALVDELRGSRRRPERGQLERRQRRGNVADHLDALLRRARASRGARRHHDRRRSGTPGSSAPADRGASASAARAPAAIAASPTASVGPCTGPPCVIVSQKRTRK